MPEPLRWINALAFAQSIIDKHDCGVAIWSETSDGESSLSAPIVFFDVLLRPDQSGHLRQSLMDQKPLVLTILEDEYLAGFFWKEPSPQNKQLARNQKRKALGWYVEQNWTLVLDRLLERIYLLRCQLTHGAAT